MKYCIKTYGCQMNVHESEKIAGILTAMGYTEGEEKSADILVFNTCCIRETAEQKIYGNLGIAKNYKKHNPNMIIVIVGCMTQQQSTADIIKQSYPFVDILLGTTNLNMLEQAINDVKAKHHKTYDTSMTDYAKCNIAKYRTSMPNGWVNIIYGCNNFCTYCIVPHVRGREQSRNIDDIVAEVEQLLSEGYKEITLLGQNVNSYGNDLNDGTSFAMLLHRLGGIDTKYRLRFMTSHPKDLTNDVIDAIAQYDNICKYIHLPIQSGSTKVLKDMNRRYDREQYLQLIDNIRLRIPNVGITTDIMVGFPNESEQDFKDTLDLVKQVQYSSAFCFIYSRRRGTPAYDMPNQIPYSTKQQRISSLLEVQRAITRNISQSMKGKVYEVLVEDCTNGKCCGRTDCGRLVKFDGDGLLGQFVDILITSSRGASLYGHIYKGE